MAQIVQYLFDAARPDSTITRVLDGVVRPPWCWLSQMWRAIAVKTWRLVAYVAYPGGDPLVPNAAIVEELVSDGLGASLSNERAGILSFGGIDYGVTLLDLAYFETPVTRSTMLVWDGTKFTNGGTGFLSFGGTDYPITFTDITP